MKTKLLLSLMFLLFNNILFAQQNDSDAKWRPSDFEYLSAPDSLGVRHLLETSSVNPNKMQTQSQSILLPYPIIFIHGLNSDASTWLTTTNFLTSQYGLTNGGRIDFCLNYDGDNTIANSNSYPTPGADIARFTTTLIPGDYYYLNFDVGIDGSFDPSPTFSSYYVESEQAAVVKQGIALKRAIDLVLQQTGRDKVILMCHSMGGLAARHYIQNSNLWQADGQHHLAKLATTGTPHGGSNSTAYGFGFLKGVDERSEAVRDLRRTYYYSLDSGVYLWGGLELQDNSTHMDDNFNLSGIDFHNVDVNCNEITYENIVGLNKKVIYTNLDYSCVIGRCSGCVLDGSSNGDGIVNTYSANLKNFYSGLNVNQFYYDTSAITEIHTDLPSRKYENMQALDEPEYYNLAYHIGFDTTYTGFMTVPSTTDILYPYDADEYKFTVPTHGSVSVGVNNIIIALDFWVNIVNSSYQVVDSAFHPAGSLLDINFTSVLNAGDYYFEIYAVATTSSYLYPYNFQLSFTACQSLAQLGNIFGTSPVCQNSSQTYSVTPLSGATSYTWVLPSGWSGTSSSNSIVSTVGINSGNICVTANNSCGSSNQTCGIVTVNTVPAQPIGITGVSPVCQNTLQTYTASSVSGATSYTWILPSGWSGSSTSNTINATVGGTAGSKSVCVTANNSCGSSSQICGAVTVNALPTATITPNGNTTFCQGSSVILNASSGSSYLWSNGATTQGITASSSGSYSVVVTNANNCSATSLATIVTVNTLPAATITPNGNTTFCQGNSVILNASAGTNYQWSNGATTQAITVSSSGTYSVVVANANNCSATSTATTVTVNSLPSAIITPNGNTTFCQGNSVVLNASAGANYQWSNGATNQSITVSSSGTYSVVVTNANNCSATSAATTVTVNSLPSAMITPNGNTTFCQGNSVVLNASLGSTYLWSSGATTQGITVSSSGTYSVVVTNANNCSATSTVTTVTVNPNPTATINLSASDLVASCTTSGCNYQWYKDGNATCTNSTNCTIGGDGAYTVIITDANGCSATSASFIITGVGENIDLNSITIHPNPNNGKFALLFNKEFPNASLKILNALGEEVYYSKSVSKSMDIDLSKEASGIYFVHVLSEKGNIIKKVVLGN